VDTDQTQQERLVVLEKQFGHLTGEIVYKDGQKKSSPLYNYFHRYNEREATKLFWLDQAERLIRRFSIERITADDKRVEVRQFIRVPSEVVNEKGRYISISRLDRDSEAASAVLEAMQSELKAFQKRYRDTMLAISELQPLSVEMLRAENAIARRLKKRAA